MSEEKEPVNIDVPEPMEQDAVPSPTPTATASNSDIIQSSSQPARGLFQKVFGSKSDPQVEQQQRVLTYSERYQELEMKELYNNGLQLDEYIEFFMIDIISGKRHYLDTLYRAQQRYNKDETLKSLSQLAELVSKWNIREAIRFLRNLKLKSDKYVKYFAELENRLLAVNLIMISRSYNSLSIDYLCKLLEISVVEEANTLFNSCQWQIVDGKVQISFTNYVENYILTNLINNEMGKFELLEKVLPKSKTAEKLPMERIKELMVISDSLMKITVPKMSQNNSVEEPIPTI